MLNVYNKYDNPKELDSYNEKYPFMVALGKLKDAPEELTSDDKNILSKYTNILIKNPESAYCYAMFVKGRWEEAEPIIMKSPEWAYEYAKFIIKGRWEEAESVIMEEPSYSVAYAKTIIKGRWKDIGKPQAEEAIMVNPHSAHLYASDVIKERWKEAEPYIKEDSWWWGRYKKVFGIEE